MNAKEVELLDRFATEAMHAILSNPKYGPTATVEIDQSSYTVTNAAYLFAIKMLQSRLHALKNHKP